MIIFRNRAADVLFEVLSTLKKDTTFLLPLNVCPVVPDTFLKAKIKFKFIDIDLKTLCMDQTLALNALKSDDSIGGVLFVKTFGIEIDVERFYDRLRSEKPSIVIIDDQCPGIQKFDVDIENSAASLSLFSSGYSKFVDLGYGGYGFVKDREFSGFFEDNSNDREFLDYKYAINAEIPLMKDHKSKLNNIYKNGIPFSMHLGDAFENWRFSIVTDERDRLLEKIFQDGLFASSHYAPIDFRYVKDPVQNSNAQQIGSRIVNLFNDFRFTEEKANKVVKIIHNFLKVDSKADA